MKKAFKCDRIYTENGCQSGCLIVENGKITDILTLENSPEGAKDLSGLRIIPGIFDTHNHGTMGYDVSAGGTLEPKAEIRGYLKGLASQGVTSIFPTCSLEMIAPIAEMAEQINDGATIVGIHSEGPYLNRVGEKGVDTGHPDVDMNIVRKMAADGRGWLKLVALAPEIPGTKEVIHYLAEQGVRTAYAHSNDNYQEALAAFDEGITVITHTANVMSGIHHRRMGGLGACLLSDKVDCEVICDGLHVSLEMLELMFRVKDYSRWMMVSDNSPMAGAPCGRYAFSLVGYVNVDERGFCLSDTGRLCGSSKPVLYGIGNLVEKLHIPMETAVQMAALNPCRVYGLADRKGSLAVGKDADFVVIDDQYQATETWCEGRQVYDRAVDRNLFNPVYLKERKTA